METLTLAPYTPRPIKTAEQYEEAKAIIFSLMDSEPGTPETDLLEVISILVHDYEQREFPVEDLDPIDAINYQMDELGVSFSELAPMVGGKGRLSELLNRKRPLSLQQIKAIASRLSIPVSMLIVVAPAWELSPAI